MGAFYALKGATKQLSLLEELLLACGFFCAGYDAMNS